MAKNQTAVKSNSAKGHTKEDALANAIQTVEKDFGKGSIMRLGDENAVQVVDAIPTGSIGLDKALGINGLPRGRVVEVYGPESSGKTTLMLSCIAQAQKNGGHVAFIDAEHALDPKWAKTLGCDVNELVISQPDTGEQALEILDTLTASHAFDMIVVDSVAALIPQSELEGEMGDSQPGLQARLMSQALRKLSGKISNSGTVVAFTNQIRMKIGVTFGSPETTTGGNALKFYSSVRLDTRRIGSIKHRDEIVGNQTKVTVKKNKLAPPFRQAEFNIRFDTGIDRYDEILELGIQNGFIEKSGVWLSYNGRQIGQGKDKARNYLIENPGVADEIQDLLREAHTEELAAE